MNEYEWATGLAEGMGLVVRGKRDAWAIYSPCEQYRYALGRYWGDSELFGVGRGDVLSVTGMNPSTATESVLDPTLRKVAHYARQEYCAGFLMTNLMAWRSTDPDKLEGVDEPVGGSINVAYLTQATADFRKVRVAAWGAFSMKGGKKVHAAAMRSITAVTREPALRVFGQMLTQEGEPRHPLYLRNDTRLVLMQEASSV